MYKLALLFAILATAQTQLVSDGECIFPAYQGVKLNEINSNDTDVTNFFEIQRISNTWNTGHCTSWSLIVTNGPAIYVTMKEVLNRKLIERNATLTPDVNPKVFNLVFPDFTSNFTLIGGGEKFVVLYACSNNGTQKQEYAWVLGLNTTLTETEKKESQTAIDEFKLTKATWIQTSHTPDSCKSGGTRNVILSPIIVLIVGFLVTKELY